jgi:hypothetical protein
MARSEDLPVEENVAEGLTMMNPCAGGNSLVKAAVVAGSLALASFSAAAQTTADSASGFASVADQALSILSKQSFSVGVSYSQATFKSTQEGEKTQITDNGTVSPTIDFNSSEKLLKSWPMKTGALVVGWDIRASASYFDTHYQLVNSAFRGDDIGTKVSGGYVGVAPGLFFKIGPLYPDSDIYWKVGFGAGPGLLKSSGTALFPDGTVREVGASSPTLALYTDAYWQLDVGHWRFGFGGKGISSRNNGTVSLESYGFGIAYKLAL